MRHRYVLSAPALPPSPSPISHAVVAGDHCYISGQLATDDSGAFRAGTAREEAEQAFRNLFAALEAAGFNQAASLPFGGRIKVQGVAVTRGVS